MEPAIRECLELSAIDEAIVVGVYGIEGAVSVRVHLRCPCQLLRYTAINQQQ